MVLRRVVNFLVTDRPAGFELQNVGRTIGANDDFQPTENVRPHSPRAEIRVVSADRGAPAAVADDIFVLKARQMPRKLPQALFDMFRQPQAVLLMQPFALLFAECLSLLFPAPQLRGAIAALNGTLKSLVEIHSRAAN